MKHAHRLFLPILLLVAAGCATTPASRDSRIFEANSITRTLIQSTDAALNAHLISSAQAQAVSNVTAQLAPLIDSAKAANDAGDTTNADKTTALISALIAGLSTYVPPKDKP